MRNLTDLETSVVSGGACSGTAAWSMCISTSSTRTYDADTCSGGRSGVITETTGQVRYFYCEKTLPGANTRDNLDAFLKGDGYCDWTSTSVNDMIFGFTTYSGGYAGTGDNGGTSTIGNVGCT